MDALTSLALIGTGQKPDAALETLAPEVAAAVAALGDSSPPLRLLLAAGARSVLRMAALEPVALPSPPAAAPVEDRPACSARATRVLADLLNGPHDELLLEALDRLHRAGQRLPHSLLPDALRARTVDAREAIASVLGERGRWLAMQNSSWSWATGPSALASVDELEQIWREGAPADRRKVLARARSFDAARARGWLEASWPKEAAERRLDLIGALASGLGSDDEAFLERALDDRSAPVREAAQRLLAHVPRSAFVERMTARADAMLSLPGSSSSLLGRVLQRASSRVLHVTPPEIMDAQAERDGLHAQPPKGVGLRAFWLQSALSAVSLAHWEARFDQSPDALLAAAAATEWSAAVVEGWTRAALREARSARSNGLAGSAARSGDRSGDSAGDSDANPTANERWLSSLWRFWQNAPAALAPDDTTRDLLLDLLRALAPAEAAARVMPLFDAPSVRPTLALALSALRPPWSDALGTRYVHALHRHLANGDAAPQPWGTTLLVAARALPAATFAAALALIPDSAAALRNSGWWPQAIAQFTSIVAVRRILAEEFP